MGKKESKLGIRASQTSEVILEDCRVPMEYLLGWRMALAKDLLRRKQQATIAEVAEHVGYSSASTFSVAFTRHVGLPPTHYAREQARERSGAGAR